MRQPNPEDVRRAEEALRTLGAEDLLFAHTGTVMARPGAYLRLAQLLEGGVRGGVETGAEAGAEIGAETGPEKVYSNEDVFQILKNVGVDASCGACACQAFTGSNGYDHTCGKEPTVLLFSGGSPDASDAIRDTEREHDELASHALWAHCVSEHAAILSPGMTPGMLIEYHVGEHRGPGGIRNHDESSRFYSLRKLKHVLSEREKK